MTDENYMQEALAQARKAYQQDEVPVGAIIVFQDQIIARAFNQVEELHNPTAHAEIIAITQATKALSHKWLLGCTMYVTIEPCSMCAGALVLARIKRVCFGATDPKTGACGSILNIAQHNALNHHIELHGGIQRQSCADLMRQFFQHKRKVR